MHWWRRAGLLAGGLGLLLLILWLVRAPLARWAVESYFRGQGIESSFDIREFDLGGATVRVALGGDIRADNVQIVTNPDSWIPEITEVHVTRPVVHARLEPDGRIVVPSLQNWLDSLSSGSGGRSRYISENLVVTLNDAHVFLATPYGPVAISGDARTSYQDVVWAKGTVEPTQLTSGGNVLRIAGATIFISKTASGYQAQLEFTGGIHARQGDVPDLHATITTQDVTLSPQLSAAAATVKFSAPQMTAAGAVARNVAVDARLHHIAGSGADVHGTVAAAIAPDSVAPLLGALPPALARPLAAATRTVSLAIDATVAGAQNGVRLHLNAPAVATGADKASLRITSLDIQGTGDAGSGTIDGVLDGPLLPYLSLAATRFSWSGTRIEADGTLNARLSYDRFHGVDLLATGHAETDNGLFRVTLAHCAPLHLAAYQAGRAPLATGIAGTICPAPDEPIVTTGRGDWRVAGTTPGLSATFPAANARVINAKGSVTLFAHEGALPSGTVQLAHADATDVSGARFRPLSINGPVTLTAGHIKAHINVAQGRTAIGTVDITHAIDTNAGTAVIHIPRLAFAPDGLQPSSLSPLLTAVTRAKGNAAFDGSLAWSAGRTTSHGRLELQQLDFRTPLGMAHGVTSTIVLTSLLPIATAPAQHMQIARVDWTLPLTTIDASFALAGNMVQIASLSTNIAKGTVTLDPFALDLASPRIAVTAHLTSIDLTELVAASNLGKDVTIVGHISGTVPVASMPEGIRITNGHISADGPGRLMIKRTLWTKGDTTPVNAVQDFAYQALENLAFDSLTADLNSIQNGRLGIVFHIKGRNDPPTLQEARINLFDLINGHAFDKPIPLPSNTPIDLTLDSTLNFDELLRSYSAVWTVAPDQKKEKTP